MSDPITVLTTPPPTVSERAAAALLHTQYGISGELKQQVSERDQNFLVRQPSGEACVLKIANSAESFDVTDFQIRALLHIESVDPDFPAPRIVRTLDEDISTEISSDDGRNHTVRVLSWLEGQPLRFADPQPDNASQLGEFLARLGVALRDFDHPASDYSLLWDIKRSDNLEQLIEHVVDDELRSICSDQLQNFVENIQSRLKELRWQVIYNDLNASNVLVDEDDPNKFAGIIDFGDMLRSPLVIDVAVAAAYLCGTGDDALKDIHKFLTGYNSVTPLQERELDLLYNLVLLRNCMTILITNWRAARYPENRDYILRNEGRARSAIETMTGFGHEKVTDGFRMACS